MHACSPDCAAAWFPLLLSTPNQPIALWRAPFIRAVCTCTLDVRRLSKSRIVQCTPEGILHGGRLPDRASRSLSGSLTPACRSKVGQGFDAAAVTP